MRRLCLFLLLIFSAFGFKQLYAQITADSIPLSNLRKKIIATKEDNIKLDTFSIVPNTVLINGVANSDVAIDYTKAILYWKVKPAVATVVIQYRVFPYSLVAVKQHKNYDSVVNKITIVPYAPADKNTFARGAFDFGNIKAEGSLGRQVGFGNRQDAVVNSNLNLQLSGMLGDSIELQAAITDNNLPIQPDGNTQQLNEFDQVFLQFKKKGWQLNLGDIDIRQNDSYFLNFYKRLQGIYFKSENQISKNVKSNSLISGSVAKGKFTRQLLQSLEGNQGPYRLKGPNNEFFFVVLANTERVFYDGQLLQRGEDQDYVINYNTAEITFTPRRMITKDSRIQIEFEFAERNFLNTNLFFSQELSIHKKLNLKVGVFRNSDAKNSTINQDLDVNQKQFLAAVGDSVQQALYPSAFIDSFAADKIMYEKIYAGLDSFYRYSTNPATAKYSLSFIELQQGAGDYVPDFNGANGKVYKYVAPIGNIKQGRYAPVQILVTPKLQSVVNMGLNYQLTKNTIIKAELAASNKDVNTFSSKDNGDDRGWAAKVQIANEHLIKTKQHLVLTTALDYEWVQQKFTPLERLRSVEFSRDWGLPLVTIPTPADESIIKTNIGLADNKGHSMAYQVIHYRRSDHYSGLQNSLRHTATWKGWGINNQLAVTSFNTNKEKGQFARPIIDISKLLSKLHNWKIGAKYTLEKNAARDKQTDTLTPLAFSFDTYALYLKSDERKQNRMGVTFFSRSDKYGVGKNFEKGDRSLNLNLQAELLGNPKRQLYLNTTFRKLKVLNSAVSKLKQDETILSRAEYRMHEWKGLVSGDILYEVGAGQEQRRDFAYLEVPAGTLGAAYTWLDYNNDGVQQLNEFEIAAFRDQAKFIQVFTPTNEFIKANYITFNYRLDINPKMVFTKPNLKGWAKLLSRLNFLTSFQTSKKSLAKGSFEFNPFKYAVTDTALITVNNIFLNTLSFNRLSSKWGVDITNLRNTGKALLTYGYESRRLIDWSFRTRWNVNRSVTISANGKMAKNQLLTPQFANRNYQLSIYSAEPLFTYIKGTSFRLVGGYKFEQKKNEQIFGGEQSKAHSFTTDVKYNLLQNSAISGKFIYSNIQYNAVANTTVSYIMLDGLLPGKNYLWTVGVTKRLLNNLELRITYDGRKAGTAKTVHIGNAAITALF
ncbi:MAG: hypothetical protein RL115_1056 [Bacteroidota bacterium]